MPVDDPIGVSPVAAAGGLMGSGSSPQAAAPLLGAAFAADNEVAGRLDGLGDAAEPFRLALKGGGKLLFLETRKVAEAVTALEGSGAQQVYDPR